LNTYSISLLVVCEFLNCLGNLWVYYVCINFGILENLLSLIKGGAIVLLAVPLCLDICYTLLQKVNPCQLSDLVEDKMKTLGYVEGVISVRKWHLWCLDKAYRVITVNVEAREDADPDKVRMMFEKKLKGKWCESLTVHITQ
jgi:Co/Zn/Cd efflux system component